MVLKQDKRLLNLQTPLGENELLLTSFCGREEMSRLFTYELEMLSDNNGIAAEDIVGKNVTIVVKLADDTPRYFNGFVNRFSAGDEEDGRRGYRATVVPWLWFLTQTSDCRIFQKKKVPDIIEQIFSDLGFSDFDVSKIQGNHPEREYCVQYRETDFDFISRLAEEEGVFYFFQHEDGKHKLVLADDKSAYYDLPENEVDYPASYGSHAITDHLTSWEHRYEFRTGKIAHTDYNFKTPSTNLITNTNTVMSTPGVDKYEIYDYPGEYGVKGDGDALAKSRMEEVEAGHDMVEASSTCKTFSPGGKFKVGFHRSSSEEGNSYVIQSIEYKVSEPLAYETGVSPEGDYRNKFTCIPDSVAFRPQRITPRPFVKGSQTAVVVGPKGEEIYTDEHARVKVQFYWDREGKRDENSSCWIRVAQAIAGKQWGFMAIPRIGQEVIVHFLEGDPDQPIIVGSVYNAEQSPHYSLPGDKTRTLIKTNSSPGGSGFNEIRLEDKKDSQQIFIHGEKDFDLRVKEVRKEFIGKSRHMIVEGEKRAKVAKSRHSEIVEDSKSKIGGNQHHHTVGESVTAIDQNTYYTVGGNLVETFQKNHVKVVTQENWIDANRVVIKAASEIYLEVGGSFISISPQGVIVEGPMVNLNCSNPPSPSPCPFGESRAPEDPEAPAEADNSTSGQKSAPD